MSDPKFKAETWAASRQMVVSPDGLTVSTAAVGYVNAMAEVYAHGPLYYEVTLGGAAGSRGSYETIRLGFHSIGPPYASDMQLGIDLRGYVVVSNNNWAPNVSNALYIGDTAMLAIDEVGRLWAGKNGAWFSGGNPSSRSTPLATLADCRVNIMPLIGLHNSSSNPGLTFTCNFSDPTYPAPTGFALFSAFPTEISGFDLCSPPITYNTQVLPPLSIKVAETPKLGARHFYFSGRGRVAGTVKTTNSPANTPVHRRVRLFRDRDAHLIAEQWSDPITGAYSFDYIDASYTYTVLSYDHTGLFRAVVADNLIPTIIPAVTP